MARKPSPPAAPFKVTPLVFHVLLSLAGSEAHAYGIMKDVARSTRGRLRAGPGSIHFTLSRLLDTGLIQESAGPSGPPEADARRRYYRLTAFGSEVLRAEAAALEETVALVRARHVTHRR